MVEKLFAFHNWVKRQLVEQYVLPRQVIVDIGFGKGGDLHKYSFLFPKYLLGVDIDAEHLREAQKRFSGLSTQHHFERVKFVQGDLTQTATFTHLVESGALTQLASVDVFACQNALTYFPKTLDTLCSLVHFIAQFLKPGGYWFGTCVDGKRIEQLVNKETGVFENSCARIQLFPDLECDLAVPSKAGTKDNNNNDRSTSLLAPTTTKQMMSANALTSSDSIEAAATASTVDNARFQTVSTIDDRNENNQTTDDAETKSITNTKTTTTLDQYQRRCGRKVHFHLRDSILGEQGVLEYLVDFEVLLAVTKSCALRLVDSTDFEVWYNQRYNESNLSLDEMEISFLSRSFVFQKL
jgi:SAM-dependent methyltransferase